MKIMFVDLRTAILHEHQVELFTEWGDRWFNLKRTGNVDAVMTIVTPLKSNGKLNFRFFHIPAFPRFGVERGALWFYLKDFKKLLK